MSETLAPRYVEYVLTVQAEQADEVIARLQARGCIRRRDIAWS